MTTPSDHRMFRAESVTGSLGVYLPATAAARVVGLARGIILARLISEQEFGLFQITLLVVNLLNPLCGLGLNEGVARYVPMYETQGRLASYLRRVMPFVFTVAMVLSAAVYFAAQPLGQWIYETAATNGHAAVAPATWSALTRIAAACTFGTVVYFLLLAVLKGLRMFRAVSLLELLNNVMFTALAILLSVSGWRTAGAMMGCYGVAMLAVILLFASPLGKAIRDTGPPVAAEAISPISQLVQFSVWAAAAAVIWQALQYYPMWFLQKTHGPSTTAVFGGVRLITQVVVIGAVAVVAVVQTSVTKMWESAGHEAANRRLSLAYKVSSLLMLAGCIAFAAAAGPIMRLFPPGYAAGVRIVPMCLMFFLISGHLTFLTIHFALVEKMRHLFLPWAAGLAGNVVFGILLVKPGMPVEQALVGTAWAGSLGMTAALALAIVLLHRERRPIDTGTVVLWAAIYALALPIWAQLLLAAAILLATLTTQTVFSVDEKREILDRLIQTWRRKPQSDKTLSC